MLVRFKRDQGLFLEKHVHPFTPVKESVRGTVHALPENEHIFHALKLCLKGHRSILITDQNGIRFRGMVNSRILLDYLGGGELNKIFRSRKHALKTQVRRIMVEGHKEIDRVDHISHALKEFKRTGEEAMPVVSGLRVNGLITEKDIIRNVTRKTGVSVRELMTIKPAAVSERHSIYDVSKMLVNGGYSRLPVVRDSYLCGIVTPFDIISHMNQNKKLSKLRRDRSPVEEAMNKSVISIGPEKDIKDAVEIMVRKDIGMLPVVQNYKLVGLLTQRDILECM
jgi:CBS domain-containing protein